MNIDQGVIIFMVLIQTAVLAYALTHLRRRFLPLYCYVAVLLVLFLMLLAIVLRSRGMLQLIYPWGLPLIFLMPTLVQYHYIAITKSKTEDWVYYFLFLMPIFSIISGYGILTDAALYQKNLDHLLAGEFLELEHLLGGIISSLPYVLVFSIVHSIQLVRKLRSARFTGPFWVHSGLPVLQIILSLGCFFAVVSHVFGISSGQYIFFVLSMVSLAMGVYVVSVTHYEELKLTSMISNAQFFAPSKNGAIDHFLYNLDGVQMRVLFLNFSKPNLVITSLISNIDWQAFFTEQRLSWPEFKSRVRIRYAIQQLRSNYLDTKTVESLSLELGFKSRKSFYTAFESVTGESFHVEVYRKKNTQSLD